MSEHTKELTDDLTCPVTTHRPREGDGPYCQVNVMNRDGVIIGFMYNMTDSAVDRFRTCMNACAGIENPAAIKDVIDWLERVNVGMSKASDALAIEHLEVVHTFLSVVQPELTVALNALRVKP